MILLYIGGKQRAIFPTTAKVAQTDSGLKLSCTAVIPDVVGIEGVDVELIVHINNNLGSIAFSITELSIQDGVYSLLGETLADNVLTNDEYTNNQDIFGGPIMDLLWTLRDPGYRSSPRPLTIIPHEYLKLYSSVLSVDQSESLDTLLQGMIPNGYIKDYQGSAITVRPRKYYGKSYLKESELAMFASSINHKTTQNKVIYKLIYSDKGSLNSSSSLVAYYDPDADYYLDKNTRPSTVNIHSNDLLSADYSKSSGVKRIVEVDISVPIANAMLTTPTIFDPCYSVTKEERLAFFRTTENQDNNIGGFVSDKDWRPLRRLLMIYYFKYHYRYDDATYRRRQIDYEVGPGYYNKMLYSDSFIYGSLVYVNNKYMGAISSVTYDICRHTLSDVSIDRSYDLSAQSPVYKTIAWTQYREDASAPRMTDYDSEGNLVEIPVYRSYKKHIWR